MKKVRPVSASLVGAASLFAGSLFASSTATNAVRTGPQVDGPFHKIILDEDQTLDGKKQDTLKDPMELAVAPDGRVFYAQRNGTIKMWRPDTKAVTVIAQIPVF